MRRAFLLLLFLWATPSRMCGEIVYAITAAEQAWQIFWFDSDAPGEPLGSVALFGDFDDYLQFRIEFDPVTHELYGFGYPNCQITCPESPVDPARIDLISGQTTLLDWPGFPSGYLNLHDVRIDPATREARAIGVQQRNFRYSLNDLQVHVDQVLDTPGRYMAIAHPPAGSAHEGETLAIRYVAYGNTDALLARIGGVGGSPPASSGEVTFLGEIEVPYFVRSFDISPQGTAFLLGPPSNFEPQRLYKLNLETLQTEDLGEVVPPSGGGFVYGIAAAPPGLGQSVVEVPTLSRLGLAALALALASGALRQLAFR